MRNEEILSQVFSARISAVQALRQAADIHETSSNALKKASAEMELASAEYGQASISAVYAAFADLIGMVTYLVEWRAAVLNAANDADRFLKAAKERYRLWENEYSESEFVIPLQEVARSIQSAIEISDVATICSRLASIPLPIGVFAELLRAPPFWNHEEQDEKRLPIELAVAFLKFTIDGSLACETHFVSPGEAHDLDLEVRVSRWPDDADSLALSPISIEAQSSYEFPTFNFPRPSGSPPFIIRQRGRAILKVPQGLAARPFEFKYSAEFLPRSAEQPVAVVGLRTLRIESIDLRTNSLTGYRNIDRKILQLRDLLRLQTHASSDEARDILNILLPLANLAGRSVQDNLFKGCWSEKDFQKEVRDELRRKPEIGAELQEHPRAAGGITDLVYREIPIELKSETKKTLSLSDCERFTDQALSYIAANGKRLGVLCVLDSSPKSTPPFPVEDGFDIRHVGGSGGGDVSVLTILIQGNLARPRAKTQLN